MDRVIVLNNEYNDKFAINLDDISTLVPCYDENDELVSYTLGMKNDNLGWGQRSLSLCEAEGIFGYPSSGVSHKDNPINDWGTL